MSKERKWTHIVYNFLRSGPFTVAAAPDHVLRRARLVLRRRPVQLPRVRAGIFEEDVNGGLTLLHCPIFFQEPEPGLRPQVVASVVVWRASWGWPRWLVQDVSEEVTAFADLLPAVVNRDLVVVVLQNLVRLVQFRMIMTRHWSRTLRMTRSTRCRPRAVSPVTTLTSQLVIFHPDLLLFASQRVELIRAGWDTAIESLHRSCLEEIIFIISSLFSMI